MQLTDLLRHTVNHLDHLGLDYLVTGSVATIAYGEPRFTNDIDIAIDLPIERVTAFCAGYANEEFYLSAEAISEAARTKRHFNVIHPGAGYKIDFILLTDSEFDRSRRARGRAVNALPERTVSFASPEDVILKKMVFFQEGGSEKHMRDIAGVLRLGKVAIDRSYIYDWAVRLGLTDLWEVVQRRADEPPSTAR